MIPVLLEQHGQVQELFAAIMTATGASKLQTFDQLQLLLARHETAEEMMILRSVARDLCGEGVAKARNEDEDKATHVLAELEKLDVSTAEFTEMLATFEKDVAARRAGGGRRVPARAVRLRDLAAGRDGARAARHREVRADARHPAVAGSTATQYAPEPPASVLDHARDAVKKASG